MKRRPERPSERPDARREAFRILRRVEQAGAFAGILLEQAEPRFEDPRDAALLHEIVLGVLRRRAVLDHAIERVASRRVAEMDGAVRTALRLAAHALLFLDRVPGYAAVDTAVELVKGSDAPAGAGFVNGVARRLAREGARLLPPDPAPGDAAGLALATSHPSWWVERLIARVGPARAGSILAADNRPAPTVLRARRGLDAAELGRALLAQGVATEPGSFAPAALRVVSGAAQKTAAFREGAFWIQDEASQLVPALLGARPGPRIADLCAAPGGKTLVLADAAPDALVVAADRHPARLARLARNLARMRVDNVVTLAADMAGAPALRGPFDQVLVDAPCSGTGTLRRHPEIRWRLEPGDLGALADRQGRLLDTAAALCGPTGEIVYAVCSLEPEEGDAVVDAFLARRSGWERRDPRARLPAAARALVGDDLALRTAPDVGDLDGFFAALIARSR